MMRLKGRHIHFVGVGGIGMSAVAHMARELGAIVSGCDVHNGPIIHGLAAHGCQVHYGQDPAHLSGIELVVRSSAVPESNPEIQAALARHIPVVSRARMLARLTASYSVVAVAGAHGKTTTTWIAARLLLEAHYDPLVMVGGIVAELGGNYRVGGGSFFVTEVDESDGSLLEFEPMYSIVTNLDLEHVDRYPDLEAVKEIFRRYLRRTKRDGCVIVCADSPAALEALDAWRPNAYLTYGFADGADVRAENVRLDGARSILDVRRPGGTLRDLTVTLPGRHNVQNALAGVALASALGVPDEALRAALGHIASVGRRLEVKGSARGVTIIDDYGHHPTEIQATIQAALGLAGGRLLGVFQPHRYTRTFHLAERFGDCFDGLERLIVLPIYGAGEPPIEGVTAERIVRAVREHGRVECAYVEDWGEARRRLLDVLRPGDTLLTIGAGNVYQLGEQLLADLMEHETP